MSEDSPLGADAFIAESRRNLDSLAAQQSQQHLASIDSKLGNPIYEAPLASEGISQVVYQSVPISTSGQRDITSEDILLGLILFSIVYLYNKK